jgi:hypothetical protein
MQFDRGGVIMACGNKKCGTKAKAAKPAKKAVKK